MIMVKFLAIITMGGEDISVLLFTVRLTYKMRNLILLLLALIFLLSGSTIFAEEDDTLDLRNLDSVQVYEVLDREANIDPETGVRKYDGYHLLRVQLSTEDHINVLKFLEKGMKSNCQNFLFQL